MTTSRKYRRSTVYKISFPTAPSLTVLPERASLEQRVFSHDLLTLNYSRPSSVWFETLKTGTPIIFSWTNNNRSKTWLGYVSHVSKNTSGQKDRPMEIVCVGASYVLKARASRTFRNTSVTEAAQKIAKEFGFKFIGENSARKFEQLSMSGESYWEWLQKQAKRIGYGFYVDNTTMYMRPLDKLLNSGSGDTAILSGESIGPVIGKQFLDKTLDSFTILNGSYIEQEGLFYTTKVTGGVNPLSGKVVSGKTSPNKTGTKMRNRIQTPLFTDYSDEVVHAKYLGKQASKDLAEGARLNTPASVLGQGDTRLYPYARVYIQGTGIQTDGFWMVKEVLHNFKFDGNYRAELKVLSDGIGDDVSSAFRRADATRLGTINLQEKGVRDLLNQTTGLSSYVLVAKTPAVFATQQGFNQLGNYWRHR